MENSRAHLNNLFFDPRRYDLARFGRFKMNNKLCLSRRIAGYKTAEDIIAPLTGELLAASATKRLLKLITPVFPALLLSWSARARIRSM